MTAKTGIVFDMDGTLIDSSAVVPDAFIKTLAQYGVTVETRQEIIDCYPLGSPIDLFSHFIGRRVYVSVVEAYHHNLSQEANRVQPYAGIRELLDALQPQVKLGLFTGASHGAAEILLGATGLLPYFAVVVGGDEIEHPKPAPDGVLKAFEGLSLDPKDGFYIGDADHDMHAAKHAGGTPIGAGWGHLFTAVDGVAVAAHPLEVLGMVGLG